MNDGMGEYVANQTIKLMLKKGIQVLNSQIIILGFTFKENCPDTRNTRVVDIVHELQEYGITPVVADPAADASEAKRLYGIEFAGLDEVRNMDAVILAVAHDAFKSLTPAGMNRFFAPGGKVLLDIKGIFSRRDFEDAGYVYWRL